MKKMFIILVLEIRGDSYR